MAGTGIPARVCSLAVAALVGAGLPPATAQADTTGVRIAGAAFTLNGAPFVARGLTLVGVESPDLSNAVGRRAAEHLDQAEMTAARGWHANTIRFQVSQRGLDPQDPLHSAAYDARIRSAVALARKNSFVVILSMQTQSISGGSGHVPPDAATLRAWRHLAPMFGTDRSVVFELFNEPPGPDTAANWARWRDGGGGAVGHQQLLDAVRATGAVNVVVADGLHYGESLRGVPLLADPLGQVAYGIHPYLIAPIDVPSAWPVYFGDFAAGHPVLATEFGAASQSHWCEAAWPTNAARLVAYLRAHRLGLGGLWAFDITGTATTGWTWAPNTFTSWRCGVAGRGPGQLIRSAYAAGW